MKFSRGQRVLRKVVGAVGTYLERKEKVSRVDKRGVWLSNGQGKKPSGPFHPRTGRWLGRDRTFGLKQFISPIVQKAK